VAHRVLVDRDSDPRPIRRRDGAAGDRRRHDRIVLEVDLRQADALRRPSMAQAICAAAALVR
jgi:hypothetical protein